MIPSLTVRTRSCNDELYSKMRSFIPDDIECIAHTAYDHWEDASRFLHDTIERTKGYLLVCDEDCFILKWDGIRKLVGTMNRDALTFCGVPDAGVIPHRCWSRIAVNPSFTIFDCDDINEMKKTISREDIDATTYLPWMENQAAYFSIGNANEGHGEPFNGLFYWLMEWGTPLYLRGDTLGDGVSTIIKGIDNEDLAVHSWLSRDKDPKNQARIQKIYELALKLKK